MTEQTAKIQGYVDPRTGEYVLATEANREEVEEGLGFLFAWKFYWDGPRITNKELTYDRETWLEHETRAAWFNSLTDEQRQMLADAPPPEEVLPSEDAL